VPDSVLFALDSARISRGAEAELAQIADAARGSPDAEIWIEGHTDTSGTREHNWELSDTRARAVADCLVSLGVDPRRLHTKGLGESGLAVPTPDEVREAANRRVVIRFIDPAPATAGYYPRRDWDR
jgi:outer membrane protein OmpA-like peptidoglycan-associated protein